VKMSLLLILSIIMVSCSKHPGFKKTDAGLYYKIHTKSNDTAKARIGDVLTLKMCVRAKNKTMDSVLFNSNMIPFPYKMQLSKPMYKGDFQEGIALLSKGDSATFILIQDSVFKGAQKPPFLKPTDELYMDVKVVNIQSKAEYDKEMAIQMQQKQAELEQLKNKESEDLAKYITDNKVKVKPTASGLYFIDQVKGKGAKAENGKTVSVHYTGTLLNGTKFDSSVDRGKPFEFVLGQGQVIKGWDEGIALMRVGGKARFIIPSSIGYGERGSGPIPPCSPLVFDVELLGVK